MKTDETADELERVARLGLRDHGRGCVFVSHGMDGTSQMIYFSLGTLQRDPLPGISDDPELTRALSVYDTAKEYIAIEFIAEASGTTVPTWYHLIYRNSTPSLSA